MGAGKGSSVPAALEQVLQMKFHKLSLIPEQCWFPHFLQLKQWIELAPTPFQHTTHGNTDVILVLGVCLEHMAFVFPTFILSPFTSSPSFQFFNLLFNPSNDSNAITSSSACNNSQGHPILNSHDRASITKIKRSGFSTDPWWTPTETFSSW